MTDASWTLAAYGEFTAARGILLSVYLAIALASAMLLVIRDPKLAAMLLLIQVLYKLTTPLTVGTIGNPVVLTNLGVAIFHTTTLTLLWRSRRQQMAPTRGNRDAAMSSRSQVRKSADPME